MICPGKYVVSEDAEDAEDAPAFQDYAQANNMPPLPSYEPFDIGMENMKGKEGSGSGRQLMWTINRFLFRRSGRSQNDVRIQKQDENKASVEEKQEVKRVFTMTTV